VSSRTRPHQDFTEISVPHMHTHAYSAAGGIGRHTKWGCKFALRPQALQHAQTQLKTLPTRLKSSTRRYRKPPG
jgi:hypothetical protein